MVSALVMFMFPCARYCMFINLNSLNIFLTMSKTTFQNGDNRSLQDAKPRVSDELEKSKIWKLTEISEPAQVRSSRLPDSLLSVRVSIWFLSVAYLFYFFCLGVRCLGVH